MIVYNCKFTGNLVFTDAVPHKLGNNIAYTIDGMYEEVSDWEEIGDKKIVNSLVRSFHLEDPVTISSIEEFKQIWKKYVKNLINLVSQENPGRIGAIQPMIKAYSNSLLENFDRKRLFVTEGDGHEVNGTIIIMTQLVPFGKEKPNDPCKMTVLADSLVKEEL
jgi:hypothetical protein